MRVYEVTADCLVDYCLCKWYIKARNERDAWIKGYLIALNDNVADSGSVDVKRVPADKINKKMFICNA